jgi:cysteinyl-tRNA synthetase
MDDDFNTPQAMAVLFDLARDINRASDQGYSVTWEQQVLSELAGVLGLTLKPWEGAPLDAEALQQVLSSAIEQLKKAEQSQLVTDISAKVAELACSPEEPSYIESLLQSLVLIRDKLREARLWQLADEIRAKLGELGIALEDTVKGTVWRRKR